MKHVRHSGNLGVEYHAQDVIIPMAPRLENGGRGTPHGIT